MSWSRSAWLVALALLAACQLPPGQGPVVKASKKPTRDDAPRAKASASPTPAPASARPSAAATPDAPPGPSATPDAPATPPGPTANTTAAPALLRKPAGATTLTGVVNLDASYIATVGAGSLVSNAGVPLIAAGGGTLVANNGGSVLMAPGGALIANNGGNVIADGGAPLAGAGAGNLLATGGGAIAAGARTYALAQAGAAPALGLIAPAAGVAIGVWSIVQRAFLPIGADDAGQPVYTAFTNLAGKYELYLPPGDAGTGIVVALVDRTSADPRLSYGVLTPLATPAEVAIDEDTAVVTAYMREFLASRLRAAITTTDTAALVADLGGEAARTSPALTGALSAFLETFGQAGRALGLDKDPARARAATRRAADYVLKRFDLAGVASGPYPTWYRVVAPEKPLDVLLDIMRTVRVNATAKLAADPAFPGKTSFLPKIDARRAGEGLPPYLVRKPADFGQIMVDEYLTILDADRLKPLVGPKDAGFMDTPVLRALRTLLRELGALSLPQALGTRKRDDGEETWVAGTRLGNDNLDRLNVAMTGILLATVTQLLALPPEEQAELRARLAEPKP